MDKRFCVKHLREHVATRWIDKPTGLECVSLAGFLQDHPIIVTDDQRILMEAQTKAKQEEELKKLMSEVEADART